MSYGSKEAVIYNTGYVSSFFFKIKENAGAYFVNMYTKIGTSQRRLTKPMHMDGLHIRG